MQLGKGLSPMWKSWLYHWAFSTLPNRYNKAIKICLFCEKKLNDFIALCAASSKSLPFIYFCAFRSYFFPSHLSVVFSIQLPFAFIFHIIFLPQQSMKRSRRKCNRVALRVIITARIFNVHVEIARERDRERQKDINVWNDNGGFAHVSDIVLLC